MSDSRLRKLCDDLRKARDEHEMRHAAEALRSYLREQQWTMLERLAPYMEKAFLILRNERQWLN